MRLRHWARNALIFVLITGMGPIPEPVRNCGGRLVNSAGELVRDIFWHNTHTDKFSGKPVARSCAIRVWPSNSAGFSPFEVVDPFYRASDITWWRECPVIAKLMDFSIPVFKTTGDGNEMGRTPVLLGLIDAPPLFGNGQVRWIHKQATSIPVWRRAHLEVQSR
jgi:hypothetical protein